MPLCVLTVRAYRDVKKILMHIDIAILCFAKLYQWSETLYWFSINSFHAKFHGSGSFWFFHPSMATAQKLLLWYSDCTKKQKQNFFFLKFYHGVFFILTVFQNKIEKIAKYHNILYRNFCIISPDHCQYTALLA